MILTPEKTEKPNELMANRSKIRNLLLLYCPAKVGAWKYHLIFYILTFLLIPLFSVTALGLYVGPKNSAGGFSVPIMVFVIAMLVRRAAVRANLRVKASPVFVGGSKYLSEFPFPLLKAPSRQMFRSYCYSLIGTVFVFCGFLGGGLAANGIVFPLVYLYLTASGQPSFITTDFAIWIFVLGVPIGGLLFGLGFWKGMQLAVLGRRLRPRDALTILRDANHPPVLFLRSFKDEELLDPRPMSVIPIRYEERLGKTLESIGPVVAIGRPGDTLGFSGAARLYVSDNHWQQAVRYFMERAAAVVYIVGETEGLWWEISTGFEAVPRERLLFFFPFARMRPQAKGMYASAKEFVSLWNATRSRFKEMDIERNKRYEIFQKQCRIHLNIDLPETIQSGLFVDFWPNGNARFLQPRQTLWNPWMLWSNIFSYIFTRHHIRLQFNMNRTLWPFMKKLYEASS